ncbi:hypothetical protein MAPG_01245 [Magnaporthiopsis poae ATCC 64411]|uniref:Acetylxylan esterase n=1 Tax=Magnaporthiopsis poae (strain ATCC 64411 / 73-15) TaxID=644358 RepID=A0A0C4DN66_MAGP6|nr:hypothetical protein MAPG_01245 [Magnaporthiopsis poae ATCC 64411]
MVRSSLLPLGVSLLLAATPIVAQTSTTASSSTTSSSTSSHSTYTTGTSPTGSTFTTSTSSAATSGPVSTALPTNCVSGLQIFVARGSNEQPGLGRMGSLAANITEKIKDSRATAVDYPATFSEYNLSVGNGTSKLRSMVEDYAKMCPNSKMALLGYSQGAQAVGDLVCGTSSLGFPPTPVLDSRYEKNVVAIVLYGDPTRAVGQSWNAGTATNQTGFFPRKNNAACSPYSASMRSWCDTGDRYCAMGNEPSVHGSYFAKYGSETAKWVVERFEKVPATTNPSGSGSGSGANPATTTASSPPSSGASPSGRSPSSGGSSACFALALGLAYLLSI